MIVILLYASQTQTSVLGITAMVNSGDVKPVNRPD